MNFAVGHCYNKPNCPCKNWNGKGDADKRRNEVKQECESKHTDSDACEFLCKPLVRQSLDWLYKTSGEKKEIN